MQLSGLELVRQLLVNGRLSVCGQVGLRRSVPPCKVCRPCSQWRPRYSSCKRKREHGVMNQKRSPNAFKPGRIPGVTIQITYICTRVARARHPDLDCPFPGLAQRNEYLNCIYSLSTTHATLSASRHLTRPSKGTRMFSRLCARGVALECRSATLAHFPRQGFGSGAPRFLHQTPLSSSSVTPLASRSTLAWSHNALKKPAFWSPSRNLTCRVAAPRRTFDPRFFSSNAAETPASELPVLSPPAVGGWLLASAGLVFAVIVVGGVTRLTESGLSITEWKPIAGMIPPLTRADWQEEFEKYKATPEFKLYVTRIFYCSPV